MQRSYEESRHLCKSVVKAAPATLSTHASTPTQAAIQCSITGSHSLPTYSPSTICLVLLHSQYKTCIPTNQFCSRRESRLWDQKWMMLTSLQRKLFCSVLHSHCVRASCLWSCMMSHWLLNVSAICYVSVYNLWRTICMLSLSTQPNCQC